MMKTLNISRVLSLGLVAFGFMLIGGLTNASAQRDPFEKPGYAKPKPVVQPGAKIGKDGKPIQDWTVPSVEQRIDYYKRLRAAAAASGAPIPKVTSVLTLNELAVTGIFRTPRGYAAMVEATPIKLSYTVYPGEKFFDGQLVAVEENQLVFRHVTKTGKDKFISAVETKQLRKFSDQQEIQGTASPAETVATAATPAADKDNKPVVPVKIVSPVDEMNSQPAAPADKAKQPAKKVAKIARNK